MTYLHLEDVKIRSEVIWIWNRESSKRTEKLVQLIRNSIILSAFWSKIVCIFLITPSALVCISLSSCKCKLACIHIYLYITGHNYCYLTSYGEYTKAAITRTTQWPDTHLPATATPLGLTELCRLDTKILSDSHCGRTIALPASGWDTAARYIFMRAFIRATTVLKINTSRVCDVDIFILEMTSGLRESC
jgi:hypothetical protein